MLKAPASIPARSVRSSINCLSTSSPLLSSSLHSAVFSRPLCLTASDARKMQRIADIAKPLIQSICNTKGTFHYYGTFGRLPHDNVLQLGFVYYHPRRTNRTLITFFRPLSFCLQSNSSQLRLLLEAGVSAQQEFFEGPNRGPRSGSNKAQPVSFSRP